MKYLALAFSLLASTTLADQVYKCVDAEGKITFSSNPFCQQSQAYAKNRREPLLEVQPARLATTPVTEKIELHFARINIAEVLEIIGDVAGIPTEPVALEDTHISIDQPLRPWLNIFNELALQHSLDYRQAYGKLYIYQLGSMGETIVLNPDLLRWYQSADTWDVVLKNDGILLAMRAYQDTTLEQRLPNLLRRVREELGEQAHTNAAETVTLKETFNAGVSGSIAADMSTAEQRNQALAAEAAKRQQIAARRQSNSQQRQENSKARCFSAAGSGGCN